MPRDSLPTIQVPTMTERTRGASVTIRLSEEIEGSSAQSRQIHEQTAVVDFRHFVEWVRQNAYNRAELAQERKLLDIFNVLHQLGLPVEISGDKSRVYIRAEALGNTRMCGREGRYTAFTTESST